MATATAPRRSKAANYDDEERAKFVAVTIKMPPDLISEARVAAEANDEPFARLLRRGLRRELDILAKAGKRK